MNHPTIPISATLLLLAGVAFAEESSNEALEKQNAALQKQIDALGARLDSLTETAVTTDDVEGVQSNLENFKYQYQRERETKTALSTRSLTISGLVQVRYQAANRAVSSTDGPVGTVSNNPLLVDDRQNTFDVGAVQIGFAGNLYRDYAEGRNLSYNVRLGTSPQTGTNNSFANVLDANIAYSPYSTIDPANDRLTVTFGQQTLPFGLEVNTSEEFRPVINNAQFVAASGLGQRQIGLIVRGDLWASYDYGYNYRSSLVSYAVGLVNGNGANTADNNNYKDILARLDSKVPTDYNSWLRELRIGGTAYKGRTPLTNGAVGVNRVVEECERSRYGLDFYYNHYPWGVTYEYVTGLDEKVVGPTPANHSTPELRSESHTATFFYNFGQQFLTFKNQGRFDDWWPKTYQPFFRIDRYEPDTDVTEAYSDIYTVGFNIFFAETTKFQLNAARKIEYRVNKDSFATNELLAQFQYGF